LTTPADDGSRAAKLSALDCAAASVAASPVRLITMPSAATSLARMALSRAQSVGQSVSACLSVALAVSKPPMPPLASAIQAAAV
jgi:hypothetical protein